MSCIFLYHNNYSKQFKQNVELSAMSIGHQNGCISHYTIHLDCEISVKCTSANKICENKLDHLTVIISSPFHLCQSFHARQFLTLHTNDVSPLFNGVILKLKINIEVYVHTYVA